MWIMMIIKFSPFEYLLHTKQSTKSFTALSDLILTSIISAPVVQVRTLKPFAQVTQLVTVV